MSNADHPSKIILDIDGTLCSIKPADVDYESLIPDPAIISKIREFKDLGFIIAFTTSRNMKSYAGNMGRINAITAPTVINWLKKWDIPFDEVYFAKPWPGPNGFYVDDRTLRPKEFRDLSTAQIEGILKDSPVNPGWIE